jgi:hypothetical protein
MIPVLHTFSLTNQWRRTHTAQPDMVVMPLRLGGSGLVLQAGCVGALGVGEHIVITYPISLCHHHRHYLL